MQISRKTLFFTTIVLFLLFITLRTSTSKNYWMMISSDVVTSHRGRNLDMPFSFDDTSLFFGTEDGYYNSVNKKSGKHQWKFLTNNYSPYLAAVLDERIIYISDFDGRIYALNKNSGQEIWRFPIPDLIQPDSKPIINNDTLFFSDRRGILYALDKATGVLKWKFQTLGIDQSSFEYKKILFHFGRFYIDNEIVFIMGSDGHIYALNAENGTKIWDLGGYVFTQELPIISDDTLFVVSDRKELMAIDKKTGTIRWKHIYTKIHGESVAYHNGLIYVLSGDGNLFVYNALTGTLIWQHFTSEYLEPKIIFVDNTLIVRASINGLSGRLLALDDASGKVLWRFESPGQFHIPPLVTPDALIIGSEEGILYSINPEEGSVKWQTLLHEKVKTPSVITKSHIFVPLSDQEVGTILTSVRLDDGYLEWELPLKHTAPGSLTLSDDMLYLFGKYHRRIYAIHTLPSHKTLKEAKKQSVKIETDYDNTLSDLAKKRITPTAWHFLLTKLPPINLECLISLNNHNTMNVSSKIDKPTTYDVYELTITHANICSINDERKARAQATFTHSDRTKYIIDGFYYDKNTWKVRFAPPKSGDWTWNIVLSSGVSSVKGSGSFVAHDSDNPGYLQIHNKYSFKFDNGKPFFPVGFQDSLYDLNLDGNYTDQWGSIDNPPLDNETVKLVSMDEYFRTYRNNGTGFNLYRWGVGNASFDLWKLRPNGIVPSINEGIMGDQIVSTLKKNDYRIWMTIFGFEVPYENDSDEYIYREHLKTYIDYVVARYAPYVDIWELMNETTADDEWVAFVADYLQKKDPYNHPITTNWEKPHLPKIDITSMHWYESEHPNMADSLIANKIKQKQHWNKPVVISEIGNKFFSWDPSSALRMRVRLWSSFFHQGSLIFWNSIRTMKTSKQNANIYLGKTELAYVSVFQSFVAEIKTDIGPKDISQSNVLNVHSYGLESANYILGYFYHFTSHSSPVSTEVTISLPRQGTIAWIDPETGIVIGSEQLPAGAYKIITPPFLIDLAMKISLSGKQ